MRRILLLVLVLPLFTQAQINRSAREFASERVGDYIVKKLFKDLPYTPVSFGEIKSYEDKNHEVAWSIEHKFVITESQFVGDKRIGIPKSCRFVFYLDDKMKVRRAETYLAN